MTHSEPLDDPNAPLIAFQLHLDRESQLMDEMSRASSICSDHTDMPVATTYRHYPAPTLDEQDPDSYD